VTRKECDGFYQGVGKTTATAGDGATARSGRGDFSIGGDVVARTADDTTSQTLGRRTM
jgi:hypothetical protein